MNKNEILYDDYKILTKLMLTNIKLQLLKNQYAKISNIILELVKHVEFLNDNHFIQQKNKNKVLDKILDIQKRINLCYNDYVIKDLNKNTVFDSCFNNLISSGEKIDDKYIFNLKKLDLENIPIQEIFNELLEIIKTNGFCKLNFIIDLFSINIQDNELKNLIKEINHIFVPISINNYVVHNKTENYYWRIPNNYSDDDVLELSRELWIKQNNEYFKIVGFFKNDRLNTIFKTSQINYPIFDKIKKELISTNKKIDISFINKFIKHDYLGNTYCLSTKDLNINIQNKYKIFTELSSNNFVGVMKNFVSKSSSLKNMFDIIFLLLIGDSNLADIGSLLIDILKEKKFDAVDLIKLFENNLSFYLIKKINFSHESINKSLEKIKTINSDEVDYKKLLLINKNIPDNIKSLTLEKIEEMKAYNNEYYKQLTFVKHILNYPWVSNDTLFSNLSNNLEESSNYLKEIESKLNSKSYGHAEAKKSLLQIIGKWISNPTSQGTSFGLVGPPGVGKTLLAKNVSEALGIPFAQITLGGQNDGELLHGHGYTYSGSQPGLIIKKMVEAGKSRCILYFDELDKACSKHGSINEITSILIHLTDPNMNKSFQDRFFQGVDFPLDKVIMMFSYNDSSLVDPILLDRLKEIKVSPYTTNEKIKIIKEFTINELKKSIGITDSWADLNDELIEYIIDNYTNEAGVRNIKRKIEEIFLTLNLDKMVSKEYVISDNKDNFVINKEIITKILGEPNNDITKINPYSEIGIINGLYATNNGDGGIIPIQIFNNFGQGENNFEIKLTGKQGDVMKESVHCSLTAAISYIKRNTKKYNIKDIDKFMLTNFKFGFHVHAPSTSTPKDGPSAGCAFTSAFISRILGKSIKNTIAMTGEIELTGRITKIGGLTYKLIGAKKAGVQLVYVPKENEKDLEEIIKKYPKLIDDSFKTKLFEYIDDIINEILI